MRAVRLFTYLAFPLALVPTGLEAQACLGFSGKGFVAPAVGVRFQRDERGLPGNESLSGAGGVAGVQLEPIAVKAQLLSFPVTQTSNLVFARADLAVQLPAPWTPLCVVLTVGNERVSGSYDRSSTTLMRGLGLAIGHVASAGSDGKIIPSLLVGLETGEAVPLTGHLPLPYGQYSTVVRGGVTFAFAGAFIRPYVVIRTVDDGQVTWALAAGFTF